MARRFLSLGLFLGALALFSSVSGFWGCAGPVNEEEEGEAASTFPETCAEVQEQAVEETGDRPDNGTYTLYIDGDESQPWDAYCHNMNRSEPSEYLSVNEADNYSQIGNGQFVATTTYRRFRIDPLSLEIDPLDDAFASNDEGFDSFTPLFPVEGMTSVPAGWAEFQPTGFNDDPGAEAQVSLEDTSFVFSETILVNDLNDFFCTVTTPEESFTGEGSGAEVSADRLSFSLLARNTNSMEFTGVATRTVADCANLGSEATDFSFAAWPLEYVAQ